ncbi:helix-turn-helix domain-containing protein [Anaeromassilibacillus sp. SJQ-5]
MDKDKAAAFIEEKRKEKGLTQQQVAEALHVTRQAVSKWEQGKSLPDVDTLLHLAELFQVPVEALLGEEYTAPPAPEPPWYQNVKKSPSPPLYQEPVPLRQLPQGKPNSPWGILLCVPIGLLVVIALIWPCLKTIGYSFTSYNALSTPVWVGLQNYSNMVRDNVFQLELGNTLLLIPLSLLFLVLVGFLARAASRLPKAARLSLGVVLSLVSLSALLPSGLNYIFSADSYGLLNGYLMSKEIISEPVFWLLDGVWPHLLYVFQMFCIVLAPLYWVCVAGFSDGANGKILHVAATLLPVGMLGVVPYLISVFGFPSTNYALDTLLSYLIDYRQIRFELGTAAAVSVVLLLLLALWITAINGMVWLFRKLMGMRRPLAPARAGRHSVWVWVVFSVGCLFALVALVPVVAGFQRSIMPLQEQFLFPPRFWAMEPTWSGYAKAIASMVENGNFSEGAGVWPLLITLGWYCLFILPAAYALTFYRYKYQRLAAGIGMLCFAVSPWLYEWERMRFHLPDLLIGSSKAFLLSPWFVVGLLASVWVLRRGADGCQSLADLRRGGKRLMRMLSGLLGVAVLSSMAVYFEGRFYALLPDYSNLFHICKELGNGGSTIILAYGIVLGTVGLGLLMPTILHREPKERAVST